MLTQLTAILVLFVQASAMADTISCWHFNSIPPDNNTGTGSLSDVMGNGLLLTTGVSSSFANARQGGGSADPARNDNSALHTSGYQKQGVDNLEKGLLLAINCREFLDPVLTFSVRPSGSASRFLKVLISEDGQTWQHGGFHELDSVADKWNHLKLSIDQPGGDSLYLKIIPCFAPGDSLYRAVNPHGNYTAAGTLRFDYIVLTGALKGPPWDKTPPELINLQVQSEDSVLLSFSEALGATPSVNDFTGVINLKKVILQNDSTVLLVFKPSFPQGVRLQLVICKITDTAGNSSAPDTTSFFYNAGLPPLIISEIMYNNPGDDDLEFIELYNNSGDTVYAGGFYFEGVDYQFPEGSLLLPRACFLLSRMGSLTSKVFANHFTKWKSGSLLNSGECVRLMNMAGGEIDRVCYDNTSPWPIGANGGGSSLERRQPGEGANSGENWRSSFWPVAGNGYGSLQASPGRAFSKALVSFRKREFSMTESSACVTIPLEHKYLSSAVACRIITKTGTADTSDYHPLDTVIVISPDRPATTKVCLKNDNRMEEEEDFYLLIADVCNGNITGFDSLEVSILASDQVGSALCFTELQISKTRGLADEAGEKESWIEIHNPQLNPVSLRNFSLQYNERDFPLPDLVLGPGGFQVFYADSDMHQGALHLPIHPVATGGRLRLIAFDGQTVVDEITWKKLASSTSLQRTGDCSGNWVKGTPSPGRSNQSNGIQNVGAAVTIYTDAFGCALALGNQGKKFSVRDMDGRNCLTNVTTDELFRTELPAGIYLVTSADECFFKIYIGTLAR